MAYNASDMDVAVKKMWKHVHPINTDDTISTITVSTFVIHSVIAELLSFEVMLALTRMSRSQNQSVLPTLTFLGRCS